MHNIGSFRKQNINLKTKLDEILTTKKKERQNEEQSHIIINKFLSTRISISHFWKQEKQKCNMMINNVWTRYHNHFCLEFKFYEQNEQ